MQPAHLRKPVLWRSEHGEVNLWINTTVALHRELLGIGKACRPSGQTKEKCLRLRNSFRFEHFFLRKTLHLDAFGTAQQQPRNVQDESSAVLLDEDAVDPNQKWWITSTTLLWGFICFQPKPVVSIWDNWRHLHSFVYHGSLKIDQAHTWGRILHESNEHANYTRHSDHKVILFSHYTETYRNLQFSNFEKTNITTIARYWGHQTCLKVDYLMITWILLHQSSREQSGRMYLQLWGQLQTPSFPSLPGGGNNTKLLTIDDWMCRFQPVCVWLDLIFMLTRHCKDDNLVATSAETCVLSRCSNEVMRSFLWTHCNWN